MVSGPSAIAREPRADPERGRAVLLSRRVGRRGLNQKGVETIMFGPGDLRFAHTDQEVVALQEVRDAVTIYAAAALQLLA